PYRWAARSRSTPAVPSQYRHSVEVDRTHHDRGSEYPMADTTLLTMGNTVITTWGRDQIRRLSKQARRRGVALIGADTPDNLRAARREELTRVDEVLGLDVNDPRACRAWAASPPGGRRSVNWPCTPPRCWHRLSAWPGNDSEAVARIRNKD